MGFRSYIRQFLCAILMLFRPSLGSMIEHGEISLHKDLTFEALSALKRSFRLVPLCGSMVSASHSKFWAASEALLTKTPSLLNTQEGNTSYRLQLSVHVARVSASVAISEITNRRFTYGSISVCAGCVYMCERIEQTAVRCVLRLIFAVVGYNELLAPIPKSTAKVNSQNCSRGKKSRMGRWAHQDDHSSYLTTWFLGLIILHCTYAMTESIHTSKRHGLLTWHGWAVVSVSCNDFSTWTRDAPSQTLFGSVRYDGVWQRSSPPASHHYLGATGLAADVRNRIGHVDSCGLVQTSSMPQK